MSTPDQAAHFFATTRWSLVGHAAAAGGTHSVAALGELFAIYWQDAESGLSLEFADPRSPDLLYDREWALKLLETTLARLEAIFHSEGGASVFDTLKPCLTADTARISYRELSASLGVSEGAARVAVHRLRKRYRHLLKQEITRTLADPAQADEEIRTLFDTLMG